MILYLVRAFRRLPAPLDEVRRRWLVVRSGLLGRPVMYRMHLHGGSIEPMGDHGAIVANYVSRS